MRHLFTQETAGSAPARVVDILLAAGAHQWSPEAIELHMKAEAQKLRPNLWYYIARSVPSKKADLGMRLDAALNWTFMAGLKILLCAALLGIVLRANSIIYNTPYYGMYAIYAAAFGLALSVAVLFSSGGRPIWVISPGRWVTEGFSKSNPLHSHPEAVLLADRISAMLPDAGFEISLLYQDKSLCDPVLWLVLPLADGTMRCPILVWDGNDDIVLPC